MNQRLRAARSEFQRAYLCLLEAIEEEERARAETSEPARIDEVARAKARRALQRHGLRKVATKR